MRASVSTLLTEAHQEVDLAVLLMPEAAFLALGCSLLRLFLSSHHAFTVKELSAAFALSYC